MRPILFLLLAFWLLGCDEKKSVQDDCTGDPFSPQNGMLVCNEGNFTFGNASVSFVSNSGTVSNELYAKANCVPLGDVLQSAAIIGDKIWLVVNNSGRIAILNKNTLKEVAEITGLTSPRYVLALGENRAIISDLYNTALTVVNTQTFEVVQTVEIGASSEKLVAVTDAIVTNSWSQDSTIHKIGTASLTKEKSLVVGSQPLSMALDKNGMLWVLCQGNANENAALVKVDPMRFTVLERLSFQNAAASACCLQYHAEENLVYFIANTNPTSTTGTGGIFAMDLDGNSLPEEPLIPNEGRLFYGLRFDANSNKLWASNAKDYLQQGDVCTYNTNGVAVQACAEVGIIPGYMLPM